MSQFTNKLVQDGWDGLRCKCDEITNPTICDVVSAIDALDAVERTMVTLFSKNKAHLVVGGGGGQYVCYISTADDEFWNLENGHDALKRSVSLNVGGQSGDYLSKNLLDRDMVMLAATKFFNDGSRASSLCWKRQD